MTQSSLIFFGSDQYSAVALNTIILSGDSRKVAVVTDQKVGGSEVEKLAKTHNLKVSYYPTNKDEMNNFIDYLKTTIQDQQSLGLCASFDHLIPANIIDLFGGNLYNLHPSLLPQYRNVSPVQYAIAMGETVTGITLFRISTGIDNGEIIAQAEAPILSDDTTLSLTPRLFKLGSELFLRSDLVGCKSDQKPTRSDLVGVSLIFTKRLTRNSGFVEWPVLRKLIDGKPVSPNESENELLSLRLTHNSIDPRSIIYDLLRALTPWPGVWSNVPTRKGNLRISLISHTGCVIPDILISGKPKPISCGDFQKYYL